MESTTKNPFLRKDGRPTLRAKDQADKGNVLACQALIDYHKEVLERHLAMRKKGSLGLRINVEIVKSIIKEYQYKKLISKVVSNAKVKKIT